MIGHHKQLTITLWFLRCKTCVCTRWDVCSMFTFSFSRLLLHLLSFNSFSHILLTTSSRIMPFSLVPYTNWTSVHSCRCALFLVIYVYVRVSWCDDAIVWLMDWIRWLYETWKLCDMVSGQRKAFKCKWTEKRNLSTSRICVSIIS